MVESQWSQHFDYTHNMANQLDDSKYGYADTSAPKRGGAQSAAPARGDITVNLRRQALAAPQVPCFVSYGTDTRDLLNAETARALNVYPRLPGIGDRSFGSGCSCPCYDKAECTTRSDPGENLRNHR